MFEEIPSYKKLTEKRIIPLGWFVAETLPDVDKFIYIDSQTILKELGVWMPYAFFKIWRPAVWLQIKEDKLREEYPDDLCVEYKEFIDRYENDLKKLESASPVLLSTFQQTLIIIIAIIYPLDVCENSIKGYFSGAGFVLSAIFLEMDSLFTSANNIIHAYIIEFCKNNELF